MTLNMDHTTAALALLTASVTPRGSDPHPSPSLGFRVSMGTVLKNLNTYQTTRDEGGGWRAHSYWQHLPHSTSAHSIQRIQCANKDSNDKP